MLQKLKHEGTFTVAEALECLGGGVGQTVGQKRGKPFQRLVGIKPFGHVNAHLVQRALAQSFGVSAIRPNAGDGVIGAIAGEVFQMFID